MLSVLSSKCFPDSNNLAYYTEVRITATKSFMTFAADREYVATVVAHELAHQWFGDLVTMEWWDG
jgi:aminopeptidase N